MSAIPLAFIGVPWGMLLLERHLCMPAAMGMILLVFRVIDSIMARRQLLGIRVRVDVGAESLAGFAAAETGARDQYQLYEVIYAGGESAGRQGVEHAARWRESAIENAVL